MTELSAVDGRPSFWSKVRTTAARTELARLNMVQELATGKAEERLVKTILSPAQKLIAKSESGERINSVIDKGVSIMTHNPVRDVVGKAYLGPLFLLEKKALETYLDK